MSLVVVVVKLFYPMDDLKRYPPSWKDPAAQTMNWDHWLEIQKAFDERGRQGDRLGKGDEIGITEEDALHLTGKQLDDYMDWYQKIWINEKSECRLH
jgi:RNA polymerase I-specific transcription initiation factor RRN7